MGRHAARVTHSKQQQIVMGIVGLVVLSLGFVVVLSFRSGKDGGGDFLTAQDCGEPVNVSLTTTPEFKPQLEAAARAVSGKDDSRQPCATFDITEAQPAAVAAAIQSGAERPDLWVPDSKLWVSRADDQQSQPRILVPSLASSPLVLVGASTAFHNTSSWLAAFQNTPPALLNPLSTSTGVAALSVVQAERVKTSTPAKEVDSVLAVLAQRHGSLPKQYSDLNGLFSRAAPDTSGMLVPAPEHAFVAYQEKHPEEGLKALVPSTGTMVLDYPLVITAKDDSEKVTHAAKLLSQQLTSEAAVKARDEAGFRSPQVEPLGAGRGVGEIDLLGALQPQLAERVSQDWSRHALSIRSLVVMDRSGSMNQKAGNRSRMQLAIAAAERGLELFPDKAQLGLWAFSTAQQTGQTDWEPRVPIRQLNQKVDGSTQRQKMLQSVRALPNEVRGGTGLYDTAIAAYRTVQDSHDPRSVNSVILFTDGENEDPNSVSLEQAINTLQSLRDPARPVRIIAIGMGPEANAEELKRLARATGGREFIARDPADIEQVFIDAILAR